MPLASPAIYNEAFNAGLKPDPRETVSEWADAYMRLPSESAEAGLWRTSRFPFLKEIMDCLSPYSPVREVIFMKPVQVGGTSVGTCWMGHTIHRAPTNMLVVEPTVDVASKLSKQRITPMINLVPVLAERIKPARSRDSGNTILEKEFLGGRIALTGANSGVGLRFMAAQNLMLDEIDAYPYDVDGEGPPVDVAEKRTATFPRYKIFKLSTPLLKQTSVIEPEYEATDQRLFYLPCPFCDHGQALAWAGLTWKKDKPQTAAYLCEQCHKEIPEHKKTMMMGQGQWVPQVNRTEEDNWGQVKAGFRLNILYQPYTMRYSWQYLAHNWAKTVHEGDVGKLQGFTNLFLAETWEEEQGEKIEHSDLWGRREIYPAPVPKPVQVITASADIQDDRIEAEAVGWAIGEECYAIEKQIFWGSPGDKNQHNVWDRLAAWLMKSFSSESDLAMKILTACIDTGGHFTKEAYDFVKPRQAQGVYAIKGSSVPGSNLIAGRSKKNLAGVWLFSIGTDTAKDAIFSRLKLTEPGPGFFHWPQSPCYDEEHFEQLTAEGKVAKKWKGVEVGSYYKKNRSRNEALDLMVMNFAALAILNPPLQLPTELPPSPQPQRRQPTRGGFQARKKGWLRR